jgi:hypothetical protein
MLFALGAIAGIVMMAPPEDRRAEERLSFQTAGPWSPRVQIEADVAMVYGINGALPDRLKSWKDHGYRTHLMTGVAWGEYQDYFDGRFDGAKHDGEAQKDRDGHVIAHGPSVPYVSPGDAYGEYLAAGVLKALDAGAEAVHLEEPEFWVRAGWEKSFTREWEAMYHEPWSAPDSSCDSQYKASKLKYTLYRRALAQVFDAVHAYAKEHKREIPCYVPTHSLINYAHWNIVSPESSLLGVGCDGYIAQVWTGTARTPNVYEGREKERTFETAFLEYGVMQNLVRSSGRRIWYLNDPVEDNPNHTWQDFRANWESTLTASLLQPEVSRFEIMPWPQRVFDGRNADATAKASERVPIPREYETGLQAVIHALGDMAQPESDVRWDSTGTRGVGILVSDTMMFQRAGPGASDPHLGSFFGLALPLVKRGIAVDPVQMENAASPGFLDRYKLLILTYEGQKPPNREVHAALSAWVGAGGALLVVDDDKDPFNAVHEWWNTAPLSWSTPRLDLFDAMGIRGEAATRPGITPVGSGIVLYKPESPARLSHDAAGAARVSRWITQAADAAHLLWAESNVLILRRGPYIVAAGLDECPVPGPPTELKGRFIALFENGLPLRTSVTLAPGTRSLLIDVDRVAMDARGAPRILAAACGIDEESITPESMRFRAKGVEGSRAVAIIAVPAAPKEVTVDDKPLDPQDHLYKDGLLRLSFTNKAGGVRVSIQR